MSAAHLAVAIWLCTATTAAAQDALIVSGQLDVPNATAGGNGGVDWLRTSDRGGLQLGAISGSRADAWWTYGRGGGFIRRPRAIVSGTLDIGGGAQGGAPFSYRRFDGSVSVPVASGRTFLEAEGQIAQMATDTRRIVRLGAKSSFTPALTAGVSYYLVAWNGHLSPAVSARVDVDRQPASFLAGFVLAREQQTTGLLDHTVTLPLTSAEVFGGCAFGKTYRLQIVLNVAPADGESNRLLASLRIPLRTRTESR